jgi:hypothetical protein
MAMKSSIMLFSTLSSSQSNPTVVRVRYGQVFAMYIVLVPHVAQATGGGASSAVLVHNLWRQLRRRITAMHCEWA